MSGCRNFKRVPVYTKSRTPPPPYLFGQQPALADMAIAPFVRQFAQTDLDWFNQQSWPGLRVWLASIINSSGFANIMTKYAKWAPGDERVCFPALK